MVLVKSIPLTCSKTSTCYIQCSDGVNLNRLKSQLQDKLLINHECFTLYCGSKLLKAEDMIKNEDILHMQMNIIGGKGGFGSMLRAIGAQIEKTTNKEACRDLSGRRLRDINEEQRLKKWIAKQSERERERDERRKQRLQRLLETPKHEFHDPEYDKTLSNLAGNINDALTEGLKKSEKVENEPTTSKRKIQEETTSKPVKKLKGWQMDDEFENLSSSENDGSESDEDIQTTNENSTDSQKEGNETTDTSQSNETSSSEPINLIKTKPEPEQIPDIDLNDYKSIAELEALGLDTLKAALKKRGVKCGGTVQERAERLFNYKNKEK